jgi:hypothetical protein
MGNHKCFEYNILQLILKTIGTYLATSLSPLILGNPNSTLFYLNTNMYDT